MRALELLRTHGVEFNVLVVISTANVDHPEAVMRFMVENDIHFCQVIPCTEPAEGGGLSEHSITSGQYGEFMTRLFDARVEVDDPGYYVRHIDNWLHLYFGLVPEYCEYRQGCSNLLTAEWNGDVYPCDFFVEERYRMGSVLERTLQQMLGGGAWREFVRRAEHVPSVCRGCEWLAFCHAGCYRHRSKLGLGPDERPYPCAANERIFGHVFGRFNEFEARPGRPRLHEFLNRLERNIAAGASRSAAGNGRRQTGGPKRARLLRGALAPGKGSMREAGKIEVAILGKTIYVRASGYATQANSLGLPDILATMFGQGCTSVTFDLKKCRGMDSTFMGVIAGAAISRTRPSGKAVAVINTNDKTRQELAFIGLLPVIALVEDEVALPEELRLARASTVHWPKTERARITKIKKLHENLIALNEKNKELFGAVIEMLETELRQENSSE